MRARYPLVFLASTLGVLACIPHPDQDFEDYSKRANELAPAPTVDAAVFEAAAPPTEAISGVYYGACLSQLAYYQLVDVFSFYTDTKFVPEAAGGGKLSIVLQPLKLTPDQNPPTTASRAGIGGETKDVQASAPNVAAADGRFTIELGTTTVPGEANPITGRNVVIDAAKLTGFFGKDRFCARLNGNVVQPIQLTLEPEKNICQFFPIKDGDPTPVLKIEDFQPGSCPF
jgi:hypothetical protein